MDRNTIITLGAYIFHSGGVNAATYGDLRLMLGPDCSTQDEVTKLIDDIYDEYLIQSAEPEFMKGFTKGECYA